jgi:lipopolysaccharide transport system ATP-binding protein
MPSVLRLCDRVILFDQGGVLADGRPRDVIRQYLDSGLGSSAERDWAAPDLAPGDDVCRLKAVRVIQDGQVDEEIDIEREVIVEVEYWHLSNADLSPSVNLHFANEDGVMLFVTNDFNNRSWAQTPRDEGVVTVRCHIPPNFLAEGRVFVLAAVSTYNPTAVHALENDAVSFQVVDRSAGDGVRGEYAGEWPGVVRPMFDWTVETSPARYATRIAHG